VPLRFTVHATDGLARVGTLETPHGVISTPAFMPVGTLGAVKGLGPEDLAGLGASIMLANLYHLSLRPGIDTVAGLGGLHAFSGWERPILTDSGGYQVFSLAGRRTIDEDGVNFRSHLDGSLLRFTPESVVDAQRRLGVDIAMMLDECPPWPITRDQAAAASRRTLAWARRARESREHCPREWRGGLFGIVQGSAFRDLREEAAEATAELDFDGYAIGGVSVGEEENERRGVVEWTAPRLPVDRPRYLMGVGYPDDIRHAVACGVDLFDCVLPARNARHGVLFTRSGVLKIKNARFRDDPLPPDPECRCPLCRRLSRAFLHHLVRAGELTGAVLATLHNLTCYLDFMEDLRQAIRSKTLSGSAARPADPESAGAP